MGCVSCAAGIVSAFPRLNRANKCSCYVAAAQINRSVSCRVMRAALHVSWSKEMTVLWEVLHRNSIVMGYRWRPEGLEEGVEKL